MSTLIANAVSFDVVVVGAGVSGLHTAWRLARAGKSVIVCEARNRVGGRLLSALPETAEAPVDLGATWIWPGERQVMSLVSELGLTTYRHFDDGAMLFDGPRGPQVIPGIDQSTPSLRIGGGTAAITDGLLQRLEPGTVRLASEVQGIRVQGNGGLRVEFDDQPAVDACHVVLAVAPALALGQIAFSPALPDDLVRRAAVMPVWMGNIVKTVVLYESPFWRSAGWAGTAVSQSGPLNEIHDHCGLHGTPAALFGFTALNSPGQPAPEPEPILAQLVRLFGPEAAHPREVLRQDWSRERHTSPADVSRRTDYGLFGHAAFAQAYFGGRLHFCSCETSGGSGHIEEALAASERTVSAILGRVSG